MDYSILVKIGSAVLLSGLVGLEREQKYQLSKRGYFAGFRTFALIGLMGTLAYILKSSSDILFYIITAGMFAFIMVSYFVTAGIRKGGVGITSEVATLLIYIVGVLCGMGLYVMATTVSLITLAFLHFKIPLHKWAKHIKDEELLSTIQFAIIAFVVLPILPDKGYGPYEAFNPYVIWLMVVLVSAISFISYIAIKVFGPKRGIGLSGFLGGLISSTALTLSFSDESKKNPGIVNPYVFSVIIASLAMFVRVLITVSVLNDQFIAYIIAPMIAMAVVGLLSAYYFWKRDLDKEKVSESIKHQSIKLKSPLKIESAIKFGIVFAVIIFLSKFMTDLMGSHGLYITSVFSGLIDMDAIVVSSANLVKSGIAIKVASNAIMISMFTNTIVKGLILFVLGNRKVAVRVMSVFLLMVFAGVISLLVL
ncbi:MAG: MgtC/SapB family protein [Candidatus Gracilibacteria bacterium]|jgi:uncharacterized membrane protein (DUF4010 family)